MTTISTELGHKLEREYLYDIIFNNDVEKAIEISKILLRQTLFAESLRVLLPITDHAAFWMYSTVNDDEPSSAISTNSLGDGVAACLNLLEKPGVLPLRLWIADLERTKNFLDLKKEDRKREDLPVVRCIWTHPSWRIEVHGDDPWPNHWRLFERERR